MRFLILAFLPLIVNFSCSQKKNTKVGKEISLTVTLKKPIRDAVIKLEEPVGKDLKTVASFDISNGNTKTIKINIYEPKLYRLNIYGKQVAQLILNDTDVKVIADGQDPNGQVTITGSKDTDYLIKVQSLIENHNATIQGLNSEFFKARMSGNAQSQQVIQTKYNSENEIFTKSLKKELTSYGNSITAVIVAQEFLNPDQDFQFLNNLSKKFAQELPNSSYTRAFVAQVADMRKLAVGSLAPEINLPQPNGAPLTLSSLRGKYVLVDFWAAWCAPCRRENPNVVQLYNRYQDKGFEILGVSLDRTKEAWLSAIEEDGLDWKHVSDLKYFHNEAAQEYQVQAIPATYLIGPEGKIIAKNLRGESLEKKLKELFEKS